MTQKEEIEKMRRERIEKSTRFDDVSKLTTYQQELMDAAEDWARESYDRRYVDKEKAAFRALVERAVDRGSVCSCTCNACYYCEVSIKSD